MPVGTERLDNVTTFDIALFRDFHAGRYRISPELNLFNITNQNTVTAINTSSGGELRANLQLPLAADRPLRDPRPLLSEAVR